MKGMYDYILVTNQPAFYKIRLWNAISQKKKVLVIFLCAIEQSRNTDFVKGQMQFDHVILEGGWKKRIRTILSILRENKYRQLIVGGWDNVILRVLPFCSPKKKNAFLCESSIYEYKYGFIRDAIKKIILKRYSKVYVAGMAQRRIFDYLAFKGVTTLVGGCGLLNYIPQPPYQERANVSRFLSVGRLVPEKNLSMLIAVFNCLPHLELIIAGFGEQEKVLKSIAKSNITFIGAIENSRLSDYYQDADVFILPSVSETWGLVVEEALNNGTPVIVSDRVGCREDLVSDKNGIVFPFNDSIALHEAIIKMTQIEYYNQLRYNISKMDFISRAQHQIDCFVE